MKTNTEETTRPLAERITQVALSRTYSSATIDEDAMPYREICSLTDSEFQSEQTEAHFELILEAFMVCQETGKTPRQLADERAELLKTLDDVLNGGPGAGYASMSEPDSFENRCRRAQQTLYRIAP